MAATQVELPPAVIQLRFLTSAQQKNQSRWYGREADVSVDITGDATDLPAHDHVTRSMPLIGAITI